MRSAAVGIGTIMIIIATFVIIASIQVNTSIRNEVTSSLNEAIYQAERVLYDRNDEFTSNDQLIDEFNECLKAQLTDEREKKCIVRIYGADYEKGLLDVELVSGYRNLWGNDVDVKVRRTMIIDKKLLEEPI